MPADIDLVLGMRGDFKSGAAQHRLGAGTVRNPPMVGVARIDSLDEMQLGAAGAPARIRLPERVLNQHRLHFGTAALHRMEDQEIAAEVFVDQIERETRIAQMVEHAEKQHDIEALRNSASLIDRQTAKLDVKLADFGR